MTKRAVGAFGLMMVLLAGCNDDPGLHPATTIPQQSSIGGGPGSDPSTPSRTQRPSVPVVSTTRVPASPSSAVASTSSDGQSTVATTPSTLTQVRLPSTVVDPTSPKTVDPATSIPPTPRPGIMGAQEFVLWYASLSEVVYRQRSTALLKEYSDPGCAPCGYIIRSADAQLEKGISVVEPPLWVVVIDSKSVGDAGALITVHRVAAGGRMFDSSGVELRKTDSVDDRLAYQVSWNGQNWLVDNILPVAE